MFGISGAEFLIIVVIAVLVIPSKNWPTVFRALAKCIKFIRNIIWKITDATEQIKSQVERELPLDKIVKKTTEDVISAFSEPIKKRRKKSS